MPLWRSGPNTRTLPTVLLTLPVSKAADMAHLCIPQNQALGVCRGFVPDIQICSTHGREDLINATITSNAEEECGLTTCSDPGFVVLQPSFRFWNGEKDNSFILLRVLFIWTALAKTVMTSPSLLLCRH